MLLGVIPLFFLNSWMVNYCCIFFICFLTMMNFNMTFSWSMNFFLVSNNLSSLLIFLSVLLCGLSLISTPENKKPNYILCLSSLLFILLLVFSVNNVLLFYVFFEASLIPTLLLVVSWGYQPERLQAGTYMMIYTVCASLPLLLIILFRCSNECTYMMFFGSSGNIYDSLCMMIYLAFLVKLPMYSFHLWLPKAHVEASLAGSMILAGILLKLGGYGLIQMNLLFDISGSKSTSLLFLTSLSMWGGLLASFMCLSQTDMKAFVAYSSVGHMALVIVGILNDQVWGILSSIITMYAHGLSSSALFCMTYFTYSKIHSRSMLYMKGMLQLYPMISLFWFVLCAVNMAVPPSLNLLGEMFILPSLYSISLFFVIIMGMMIFISGIYNMYLYTSINHGFSSKYILYGIPMQSFQFSSLIFHMIPMFLIMKLELFILAEFCYSKKSLSLNYKINALN
uniref:NADH-ubiquinone oxidoreductase chain 4 n=1 Tax=Planorbella pilsbryi TaxID=2823525 RepID=A0A8E8PF54_9GAST|nr:NADH dehydrogenase subunit 4 [Planorbella pilsbryi]